MRATLLAVLLIGLTTSGTLAASQADCYYDARVSASLVLDVTVRCDPGVRALRVLERDAREHVQIIESTPTEDGFTAAYRVSLEMMARTSDTIDCALTVGNSVLVIGAAWILEPVYSHASPGHLEVRVTTAPGVDFATAQPRRSGVFMVPAQELSSAGFSAFGVLERHRLQSDSHTGGRADYEIVVLDGHLDVPRDVLLAWIADMASDAASFWRGFPGPGMKIFVVPRAGSRGVPFGRNMAGGGISMALFVGEHATAEELHADWVLVHELVHVGSPFVRGGPWLTEGLATYLEPLIRTREGIQSAADMWTEFMTYMPRGVAVIESSGLAHGGLRGWYWGGAVLMLLADVEIRSASQGRRGLEDCLRAVRRDIGNYAQTVDVPQMTDACDRAVGRGTLTQLVSRHAYAVNPVGLDRLWADLGLELNGGTLRMRDDAPLSAIRDAIVNGGPL